MQRAAAGRAARQDDRVVVAARDHVRRCAAHVAPGGVLIAGFQLGRSYPLADFDASATAAGLLLEQRWSSWEAADFEPSSSYVVSLLRRPA